MTQVLLHGRLVKSVPFALDNGDRPLGAVTEAGAEAVAEVVRRQPRLAVNDLYGPFGAGWGAEAASVTFILIDLDYFP
jgi:hypothetical protein